MVCVYLNLDIIIYNKGFVVMSKSKEAHQYLDWFDGKVKNKVGGILSDEFIHSSGVVGVKVKWIPYWHELDEEDSCVAFEEIAYAFFNKAYEIAEACGFDGAHQQGRSGGWVFPFVNGIHPEFRYIDVSRFTKNELDKHSEIYLKRIALFCEEVTNLYRYIKKIAADIKDNNQVKQIVEEIINL